MPKDFLVPIYVGARCRADELARRAQDYAEVRSGGPGLNGSRWSEWAMIEASTPERFLLIRRPLPPPGTPTVDSARGTDTGHPQGTSFVYCSVPKNSPISPTLSTLV